jgi:hypothetical protein
MGLLPSKLPWTDLAPDLPVGATPIGYAWMVRSEGLRVMPHHRWSFVAAVGARSRYAFQGLEWEVFPRRTFEPSSPAEHIEHALKYDGLNLEILRAWFAAAQASAVTSLAAWITDKPSSAYARRAWYLYELLTGERLALPDASAVPFVPLLDPAEAFTGPTLRSRRHRIDANLMGGPDFSVMVRRTPFLEACGAEDWSTLARQALGEADAGTLLRAVTWLYTKETRSSYEIEREAPSADRVQRFVTTLKAAQDLPALDKAALIRLQNQIVTDPRNHDADWRETQNYVSRGNAAPEYVSPQPEALPALMEGWLGMLAGLMQAPVDPVVAAAAAAFSFVYLHPFEDGNGRIHRFLIHYVLARRGFTPKDAILPVSAVILARPREYDAALEAFSIPVVERLVYEIDSVGVLQVQGDSASLYRHMDLTVQAEALYRWVQHTIREELPRELRFVRAFHDAFASVHAEIELPDRVLQPLVARTLENKGRLSKARRDRDFKHLEPALLDRAEALVRAAMAAAGLEVEP